MTEVETNPIDMSTSIVMYGPTESGKVCVHVEDEK